MENQSITTGNIAIITENKAAFKQIKLIQELYGFCKEKYGDLKTKKTFTSKIGTHTQNI